MDLDFAQLAWNDDLADDCRRLIRIAIGEELAREYDWTTVALVPPEAEGAADVVARRPGVVAGLPAAQLVLEEMDRRAVWTPCVEEGAAVSAGTVLATIAGPARTLLTAERLLLNLLGHLSGVATLTQRYVEAVRGTRARIYDTRKTMPGFRRLEKYAVRQGGGHNHRTGLFDAILIKDNHLAFGGQTLGAAHFSPAQAVAAAREFIEATLPKERRAGFIVEVEVDSLAQLELVLPAGADIVLLDNMNPETLRQAVNQRDAVAPQVELEASGGVSLETVRAIAGSGVDRISVGALTHSAPWWDVGLDWKARK